MKGIVYKYTNKVNGKVYIGITTRNLEDRHKEHFFKSVNDEKPFYRAIRKYGRNNFELKVIDTAENADELFIKEKKWISFYNSYIKSKNSNGYNLTLGGEGTFGYKHNETTKKKLRLQKLEFYKHNKPHNLGIKMSEESKLKISKANKGRLLGVNNPFYGKRHSDETKKKISYVHKQRSLEGKHGRQGKKLSNETKRLIGSYHKGKVISQKQRMEHSEFIKGEKHPNSLKVICLTTNEIFEYMGDAAKKYNLDRSNLTKCCKGKTKWCGTHPNNKEKLKWMYLDDYKALNKI